MLRTARYVDAFYKVAQEPVWRLLDTLKSPAGRLRIEAALTESRVDPAEFAAWRPAIVQRDIRQAVAHLVARGYPIPAPAVAQPPIPAWVVLYLALYKVRTADHAAAPLLDLLAHYLPAAPPAAHGPLLVLAAHHLARHNLLVPLQPLTDTFLTSNLPAPAQEATFNLFLSALSSVPSRSAAAAALVVRVLAAMDARQLALRPATYRALLADRFVTLQLTKHLLTRMTAERFAPRAEHLEGFLRVFARDGAIHEARKYFAAIHAITTGPPDPDHDPRFAANTLMLAAHDDRASAFAFLRRLAQLSEAPAPAPPSTPSLQKIRFVSRPADNVYDQTAALHVAARDRRVSAHRLIRAFLRMSARPTVVTHTVLVRGLLLRHAYAKAAVFWARLERECLRGAPAGEPDGYEEPAWARTRERRMLMDNAALTAGLQALVRSGRPSSALQALERWAWRPAHDASAAGPPRVRLTIISANELLVSLKRAGRPDAVFALWDALPRYAVSPNAVSLAILLQAARMASAMDDTLSAALARARRRVRSVLARGGAPPDHQGLGFDGVVAPDADAAFARLSSLPAHPYAPGGTWRARVPAHAVRAVFLQCLFGMAPSPLEDIPAPATAVLASFDAAPSALALLSPPPPAQRAFRAPAGVRLRRPDGRSWYPSVAVSNACCFSYIALLGCSGRAGEIPRVLAWMRALGLQPSEATLALALVLWAEVGVQAPLVEMWAARARAARPRPAGCADAPRGTGVESGGMDVENGGMDVESGGKDSQDAHADNDDAQPDDGPGEYGRLVRWIRGWVGAKRVPGERALAKWRGVVRDMRAARGVD